ncbi:hypothetical protein EDB83DRAFT_2520902 [Lactarius deliciosus]|nr:hypothetical protein EDB83DRAFT_2520902 [Lactarius deliciosus]
MKIAVVETTTVIWEYDPDLPGNRILGGLLDVIAAIRTLAVKIQCSSQCIEYFEKLQIETGITTPLVIPLHSNVRWGSAYNMLDRAYCLCQAVKLFIAAADELYGLITVLRHDGWIIKKILWSAFKISEVDWTRVLTVKSILQTAWEEKCDNPQYVVYKSTINDGLAKLNKYYSWFNEKPSYVLSLILHPYYKLNYIKHVWGGEEEEMADIAAGNLHAKNWQAEAWKILEDTVHRIFQKYNN